MCLLSVIASSCENATEPRKQNLEGRLRPAASAVRELKDSVSQAVDDEKEVHGHLAAVESGLQTEQARTARSQTPVIAGRGETATLRNQQGHVSGRLSETEQKQQ